MKLNLSAKRSQAALEFLTTYGWAFLVILIMIGALAYFGILKPSKLLPERCNFGSEIDCQDFQIKYGTTGLDGELRLRLKNNIGEAIQINSFVIQSESSDDIACDVTNFDDGNCDVKNAWSPSEVCDIIFDDCDSKNVGFVKGDKEKVYITATYNTIKSGSTYLHDVQGEVYSTVK